MLWIVRGLAALLIGLVLAIGLPDPARAVPASAALAWPATGATGSAPAVLEYDPHGDGLIVEAYGDLATASRIAVLVPGADTTLANFHTGLGGVRRRAPAWQARTPLAAAGPGTAVVAWLGYDAPQGVVRTAMRSERARAGAEALLRFVYQLTGHCPHATVVLIGHSYGSVAIVALTAVQAGPGPARVPGRDALARPPRGGTGTRRRPVRPAGVPVPHDRVPLHRYRLVQVQQKQPEQQAPSTRNRTGLPSRRCVTRPPGNDLRPPR
jgi:Alpha/beta hydrolase